MLGSMDAEQMHMVLVSYEDYVTKSVQFCFVCMPSSPCLGSHRYSFPDRPPVMLSSRSSTQTAPVLKNHTHSYKYSTNWAILRNPVE